MLNNYKRQGNEGIRGEGRGKKHGSQVFILDNYRWASSSENKIGSK
jgi:hypothetical protein